MSIYDKASLVLIPSGTKTSKVYSQKPTNGDGDFTFSRSTAATRVNASGNIEKETNNQLLHSNSFVTSWTGNNSGITGGELGYDGTYNASKHNATGGYSYRAQFGTYTGVCTFSIYAKAGTAPFIRLYTSSSPSVYTNFDLVNGTIQPSGAIDSKMVDVGNGWYRCSMTFNASNNNLIYFYCAGANGDVGITTTGDNIYVQHAQVEQGLVARDYIETTTTAIYGGITDNVPRLDYTDSSCPALLLEPQRFNAIDSSEYGGAWAAINANITKTENATTSPEGVNNAVKLEGLTTSSANQIVNFGTTSLNGVNVVGKTYTASVYLKPVNAGDVGTDIVLSIQRNSGDFEGFNVTTEITSADWKRYDLTYTFTGEGAANQIGANFKILRDGGTSIDDIYIWGVQFEEGSYATSYIPTYGSAVTRNQDLASFTHDVATTSWSVFMDVKNWTDILNNGQFSLSNIADTTNSLFYFSNCFGVQKEVGQAYFCSRLAVLGQSFNGKFAVTFDGVNTIKLYVNGTLDITSTLADTAKTAGIDGGNLYYAGSASSKEIKSLLVFPTALTDQEAIDLTTI